MASTTVESEPQFTAIIEKLPIANHFQDLVIHHPLYEGIANGSLPVPKYQGFIQQDQLYVLAYLQNFRIMADREEDEEVKSYLERVASEESTWNDIFEDNYNKFNFSKAMEMTPGTLDYSGTQRIAAMREYVGVALATAAPCFIVWGNMGKYWSKLNIDFSKNPYGEFIKGVIDGSNTEEFARVLNGYYDRFDSPALKQRMVDAYEESVELEYRFASAIFNANGPESIPPPKFTDLFPLIDPEIQNDVTSHRLYAEIGAGTLPLKKYATLLQQDYIYMHGFYGAWDTMEKKEADLKLKPRLLKTSAEETYQSLIDLMKEMNLGLARAPATYVIDYMRHYSVIALERPTPEGLAALYPCYCLWDTFGAEINASVPDIENNPYKSWLESVDPKNNPGSLAKFQNMLNELYEKESLEGKYRIIQIVRKSISYELQFANGVYSDLSI